MAAPITMHRPGYPGSKTAYSGFSWTTLLFGFFPALLRGDGMGLLFGLVVWLASALSWTFFLGWLPWIIWAVVYNRNHLERLLADGWVPLQYASGYHPLAQAAPLPMVSAPPGWYPDPLNPGGRRWWDGTRWGEGGY